MEHVDNIRAKLNDRLAELNDRCMAELDHMLAVIKNDRLAGLRAERSRMIVKHLRKFPFTGISTEEDYSTNLLQSHSTNDMIDISVEEQNIEGVSVYALHRNSDSLYTNEYEVITVLKRKKESNEQNSSKITSEISNLKIDSYFEHLQEPWTIKFQNLKRLKCLHVAALERKKTCYIEQISSFCSSRLLNETFHFEIRQKIATVHSRNISTKNVLIGRCQQTKALNSANLHASNTLGVEELSNLNTFYSEQLHELHSYQSEQGDPSRWSERQQSFDEVNTDSFSGSTHHPTDGTRGVFIQLKNALLVLLLQMSMALQVARKCHHVVFLAILLTQAACLDVHVNCTGHGVVVASSNYPRENINHNIIAPEGRMILLNFDYFSLGSADDSLIISDIIEPVKTQYYSGEEEQVFPPFLSRRNSLQLVFLSFSRPGKGFSITASCYELSETKAGHLTDGNIPAEGFLELYVPTQSESGGEWMRVCEENLSDRVAEVVCGELGYASVKEVSYDNGGCQADGSGRNCIRAPICGEYAYRLQDCSPPSINCISSMAVKIKCFEPGFIGCYNFGNTQLQNGFTHSSTPQCISSCRAAYTVQALAIVNGIQCFCSTNDEIKLSDLSSVEANACSNILITHAVYNASVGFCNQADDVMNGYWDSNITWFGSIIHLTCDDGYSIVGSGTLQCVPGVSAFLPDWNKSTPTCAKDDGTWFEDRTSVTSGAYLPTSDFVYPSSGTADKLPLLAIISTAAIATLLVVLVLVSLYRYRRTYY